MSSIGILRIVLPWVYSPDAHACPKQPSPTGWLSVFSWSEDIASRSLPVRGYNVLPMTIHYRPFFRMGLHRIRKRMFIMDYTVFTRGKKIL